MFFDMDVQNIIENKKYLRKFDSLLLPDPSQEEKLEKS
jgi:hypothetical protein